MFEKQRTASHPRSTCRSCTTEVKTLGSFTLDPAARTASSSGTELTLTVREFDLLAFFLRHPHQVFGREELLKAVWGWTYGDLSTVTVHVRRLREKIETDPRNPQLLCTVWGVGYRFTMSSDVLA